MTAAWISVKERLPRAGEYRDKKKPYVLVVDAKGRMSIAYVISYASGEHQWTMAKPIGTVTHWCELPAAPESEAS